MKKYKIADNVTYNSETFIATFANGVEAEINDIGRAVLLVLLETREVIYLKEIEKEYALSCRSLKSKATSKGKSMEEPLKFVDAIESLIKSGIIEEIVDENANSFTSEEMLKIQKIQRENALWMFAIPIFCIAFLIMSIQYVLWIEFFVALFISIIIFIVHFKEYRRFQNGEIFAVWAVCDGKRGQAFSFSQSSICEFTSDCGESFEINLATSMIDNRIRRGKRYALFFNKGKGNENVLSQENFIKIK